MPTERPTTSSSNQTVTSWQASFQTSEKSKKLIKRFNDFHTVDWVNESIKENEEHFHTIYKDNNNNNNTSNNNDNDNADWYFKAPKSQFDIFKDKFLTSCQSWLCLTLIGISIGLIAASLNIITEWLGDIKLGYCRGSFHLNKDFCCWGEDEENCSNWKPWSSLSIFEYFIFIFFSVLFGLIAAVLCKFYAPTAAGSGISEVKCIVSGFVMDGFLGWWTLLIKSIALPLTIASSLSVGKEGPSVHYAACVGNVIPKLFTKFGKSYSNLSQFLTAASAAGVAVAFGSPIGGVLFAIEEITSNFKLSTIWKSYYCALVATGTLSAMNPFRTGQIVMFEVKYDSNWKYFEIPFFVILGVFGGVYGILVSKFNIKAVAFRQKYLSNHAIKEVFYLCLLTSMIGYFNEFIRLDMTESMEILFHECGSGFNHNLCSTEASSKTKFFFSLVYATLLRMVLVIISYGCKVPCGIFVPSMAAGATFGRAIGLMVEWFNPCVIDTGTSNTPSNCIILGTYAFLGAAATLSGITHLTLTVVVIMFELTGAIKYIIPTMIVVGVTKIINDNFGNGCGGIADQMIKFNGLPFINAKEDYDFDNCKILDSMTDQIVSVPVNGLTYQDVEVLLADTSFKSFPIVRIENNGVDAVMLGYIDRIDLILGLNNFKKMSGFSLESEITFITDKKISELMKDNKRKVNDTTEDESPQFSFEKQVKFQFFKSNINTSIYSILDIFLKLGPRFIAIEDNGKLCGLITRKDLVKFEIYLHNLKHGDMFINNSDEIIFEKVWSSMCVVSGKLNMIKDKMIKLMGKTKTTDEEFINIDM